MLRKMFGATDAKPSRQAESSPELEKALARLCVESPQAAWAALVRADGVFVRCFPSQHPVDEDRVAAMSAAILALGERIAKELQSGDLHYALVGGVKSLNLVIALDSRYVLTLGLAPDVSLDTAFEGLRLNAIPLLQQLDIAELPI